MNALQFQRYYFQMKQVLLLPHYLSFLLMFYLLHYELYQYVVLK